MKPKFTAFKFPCSTLFPMAMVPFIISSCSQPEKNNIADHSANPLLRISNQPISFDKLTKKNIMDAASIAISEEGEKLNKIVLEPNHTFENTLRAYDRIYNSISSLVLPLDLIKEVDPREEVREAGTEAQSLLKDYMYSIQMNEDLYHAVNDFAQSEEGKNLSGFKKKFLNELMLQYKKAGFDLDPEKRKEIMALKSYIDKLGNQYSANIAASSSNYIEITANQTGGLDSSYLEARKTETGTYKIDVTYPSLKPFLKYSTNDSLRKKLQTVYYNRAVPDNVAILDSVLYLRHKLANILGFKTYAEYEFVNNMAKTPKTVWDFENSLIEKVKPKAALDLQKLLKVKSGFLKKPAKKIEMWELSYYSQILKEKEFKLDEREVRQYFEFNTVLNGLFQITQKLLGLRYEEVDSPSVWHPDVRMFNCFDASTNKLIGRFYLDMFPRENKYSHAAMFTITGGMALNDGGYEMPEASLVCNFPKPEGENPSLMDHGDVETFFHEFGHLLHCLVTKAELAYQSGPERVVLDFVEAPSQIYENWAWNKQTLSLFAKHYKTGEMIPDELLDKMLSVKLLNSGIDALRQLFYGSYALTIHDTYIPYGDDNTTAIGYRLQDEIGTLSIPEGVHFEGSFGHLMGYGAGYYSYLWSKVYAQDMWSVFEEKGALNPEVGMKYRKMVLEPEASRDPLDLVKDFLGRTPSNKGLLKDLGLKTDEDK